MPCPPAAPSPAARLSTRSTSSAANPSRSSLLFIASLAASVTPVLGAVFVAVEPLKSGKTTTYVPSRPVAFATIPASSLLPVSDDMGSTASRTGVSASWRMSRTAAWAS